MAQRPVGGSNRFVWVCRIFLKFIRVAKLSVFVLIRHLLLVLEGGDEIRCRDPNFVTLTNQKKMGPRSWLSPKWTLPVPRPRIQTHLHIEKIIGHPKVFLRKKLFCAKKVTTLPDLTVHGSSYTYRTMYVAVLWIYKYFFLIRIRRSVNLNYGSGAGLPGHFCSPPQGKQ